VRVLLDENLPLDLTKSLTGHEVFTVQGLGWAGTKNGALRHLRPPKGGRHHAFDVRSEDYH
jgi:hypothetical protein